MRKIHDVLRLSAAGPSKRKIAASLGVSATADGECIRRARCAGLSCRFRTARCASSEFHAWGDSNLYLRRDGDDLSLTVEHRAAPAMPTVALELTQRADALALEVVDRRAPQVPAPTSVDERIIAALTDVDRPLPFTELRGIFRVRTATLYERLAALTAHRRLVKSDDGYRLTAER